MSDIKKMPAWRRRVREVKIRDLVLANLETPEAYAAAPLLAELDTFSNLKKASIHNLEARAVMCVTKKIRPTQARRVLGQLRGKCKARGEESRFEELETRLKKYMNNDHALVGHSFNPTTFAMMDNDTVWADIASILSRLELTGKDVFLNSGTLLGVTRDKALIEVEAERDQQRKDQALR
mgnify:CR=1 FL=1